MGRFLKNFLSLSTPAVTPIDSTARPTLPGAADVEALEKLCDRFEREWRNGSPPTIEEFLELATPEQRVWLVKDLVQIELHYRSLRGDDVTLADYRPRFSEQLLDTSPGTWFKPDDGSLPSETEMITATWPFSQLPLAVVRSFVAALQPRNYTAGDVLVRQGEPTRELIVLLKGEASVYLRAGGREQLLVTSPHVNVLGEIGLLTTHHSTTTVIATSAVEAAVLPAEQFHELGRQFPVFRTAMMQLLAKRLGQHDTDALVGKVVHGYRIQRCAGRGGMAVVYEAEAPTGDLRVALKMMSHNLVDSPDAHARFDRELQLNRSLEHPGLLAVYEGFESLSTSFIAMEFCDGPSLASMIQSRGPFSEPDVRSVIGQLAAVLGYLHDQGICHRDLKPANVLFNSRGELKLADFGLARSACCSDLTARHELLGTPCYMAPEQLQGDRADCRADLFAVGCLVWEMLTGNRLFDGASVLAIALQQAKFSLADADVIRPGLSRDIYEVLSGSLVREPQDRTLDLKRLAAWSSVIC